jgi:hypothetical protein
MSAGIWVVQLASLVGVRSITGKPKGKILRLGSDFLRDETRDTP